MDAAKVNSPSVRGGVSSALSHLKENDTIRLALKRAVFDWLKIAVYTNVTNKKNVTNNVTDRLRP